LISKTAKGIAKAGLGVNESDPMSGFFAFRRKILEGIKLDAIGYKMLLEILVKTKGAKVKEIPNTFTNRTHGSSKLDSSTMLDYVSLYGNCIDMVARQKSVIHERLFTLYLKQVGFTP